MGMVIIVGDFNIHVDDSTNSTTKEFLSIMDSFNFVQHVAGPTHTAGHTLDLVFTYGVSLDHLNLNELFLATISQSLLLYLLIQSTILKVLSGAGALLTTL